MFYGNDDILPTEEDIAVPENRERLEWHGMLEAVLTGDVVKQEKKRLINSTDTTATKAAYKSELWFELRSDACGRRVPVQRRIIDEGRLAVDRVLEEVINFQVKGTIEAESPLMSKSRILSKRLKNAKPCILLGLLLWMSIALPSPINLSKRTRPSCPGITQTK